MGNVTTLPRSRALTRDDLDAMPDDGHRYELLDGSLIVTPAPSHRHQHSLVRLVSILLPLVPDDLEMLFAPFDVALAADTVLQPDLLIGSRADFTSRDLPVAPLLAVEVLSPSTRRIDLHTKRARYEAAGCPSYWVVDPDDPAIIAWELRDGQYAEVARARDTETFRVTAPFPVEFRPTDLTV